MCGGWNTKRHRKWKHRSREGILADGKRQSTRFIARLRSGVGEGGENSGWLIVLSFDVEFYW